MRIIINSTSEETKMLYIELRKIKERLYQKIIKQTATENQKQRYIAILNFCKQIESQMY